MSHWLSRWIEPLVYASAAIIAAAIGLVSLTESTVAQSLIVARELFGLWALGVLAVSMLIGPVVALFPNLPARTTLMRARRAIGVSAVLLAIPHVACYLVPACSRSWGEPFAHGAWWTAGILIGLLVLLDLIALGATSPHAAVIRLGARQWKALHRTVHIAFVLALVHAILLGADFGVRSPPDVTAEGDAGCLVTFSLIYLVWSGAMILRRRRRHTVDTVD